ncbi:putative F-box protein At1g65770 [Corylus avellana]|uniref:putative F-box protein At1g65770 n=1 Tax=Corylus avellana TaxID=13451 RepID=UPI001E21843F|nr:putative F-box protein At1g65770 [Corylus avellana]XP_059439455.1 putative F-box protein At1g65770 [Corylus avellana]XP_059439456.1 putative F-box protein At1g65770 [Corylus avellana]XP_059439457.1 putative F-box protein At1g65770 [Corylus avellana]XP_059439458.1 putative F-box protein At1g65770 [Corylus avellana]
MGERVEWSNLPRDLLVMIGRSLDARVDVLRFRGVCTSWRSSIPSFHAHSPRFPLKFPEPFSALESASMLRVPQPQLYLCESTLYLLQPENPFPTSSSSCCNKGWLIKVQESNSGKLHLLDPLPSHKYRFSPVPPNTLNLLNFRVVELRKAHMLGFHVPTPRRSETERSSALSYRSVPWVNKVVMITSSAWTDADESAVFVIFSDGKLAFAKFGDEKWTLVGDASVEYDDIIVYKGQFYVVDRLGNVSWIRCSSLELVPFSPPLCGLGNQKHLVESCGALYVVDRYLDRERRTIVTQPCFPKTVDFKVYKLDEEECGWVLLRSLGDRAFVLSTDWCLSVLAQEFVGCKGNCIYFFDQHETHVFSLEDSSFADFEFSMDDSHLFWEAPTLLTSANP